LNHTDNVRFISVSLYDPAESRKSTRDSAGGELLSTVNYQLSTINYFRSIIFFV